MAKQVELIYEGKILRLNKRDADVMWAALAGLRAPGINNPAPVCIQHSLSLKETLYRARAIVSRGWVQGYLFRSWDQYYILPGIINGFPQRVEVDPDTIAMAWAMLSNGESVFTDDVIGVTGWRGKYVVVWGYSGFCLHKFEEGIVDTQPLSGPMPNIDLVTILGRLDNDGEFKRS